jgi:hypothetical protein
MRTAASRTSRSLVPRDQSNRSGLQGTRSALSVTAQRLGPAACTFVRARMGHAREGCARWETREMDTTHSYLTKRTHPWRIRTHGSCYSRLLREANSLYVRSSTLDARVWGGRHWPETCICVRRSSRANSLVSVAGFCGPGGAGAMPTRRAGRGRNDGPPIRRTRKGRGRRRPTRRGGRGGAAFGQLAAPAGVGAAFGQLAASASGAPPPANSRRLRLSSVRLRPARGRRIRPAPSHRTA